MDRSRLISKGSFLAAAGLFVATIGFAATASATTITFEADSVGFKANGFASAESSDVTFADSIASDLNVGFRSPEATNQRIVVNGDDASKLLMNFLFPINFLSIDFGNDDPGFSSPGDIARLVAFDGVNQVGFTDVVMNRDDLVNQTITFSGVNFNAAQFFYANPAGVPINLIEVADNVTFLAAPAAVPEPASLILFGTGALGLIAARRRQVKRR